ncbi:sensor histidine kinase [Nonomuraea jiangxiensis]|uniref:histidine kinase n=1 Tax=Nonomuraea jiangxiensis TaxID=633440 RepID=A0A1G8BV07_9ACTN|nr:HAMP domain-containing sensor histidine kinase [Nonomuraea jiangxiensis]SDH37037.1 Histidine kinase-, DNA gyrase B-, and HSP90-like ATPase [Nonomuraea jiangxiensis]
MDRLARMVGGLLALARLEHAATAPEPVDADAVLADRAAAWMALAAEHHVQITVTGPPAGKVQAIPGALEQIVDNLVSNALRVAPPASTITLHREPAGEPATAADGTQHVQLHVIDQGPGMTAADRARAFDRFWRAPGSTHHDGTGLGLPIVRQLTHAGGGQITLNPAPGGGLDATIYLRPAAPIRQHPTARTARTQQRPPRRPRTRMRTR